MNQYGSNPLSVDSDFDGYSDFVEVSVGLDPADAAFYPGWDLVNYGPAIRQINSAGNKISGSGFHYNFQSWAVNLSDFFTYSNLTSRNGFPASIDWEIGNPNITDSDGDGMPDSWEDNERTTLH